MYLDTATMIGICIALIAGMFTIGYSIYVIKTQDEIITRLSTMNTQLRNRNRERL